MSTTPEGGLPGRGPNSAQLSLCLELQLGLTGRSLLQLREGGPPYLTKETGSREGTWTEARKQPPGEPGAVPTWGRGLVGIPALHASGSSVAQLGSLRFV
jgi:hypothetical protein